MYILSSAGDVVDGPGRAGAIWAACPSRFGRGFRSI